MTLDTFLSDEKTSEAGSDPAFWSGTGAVLIDMGNLIYRMFYTELATEGEFSENFARHLVFNSLLSIRKRFPREEYPHMILALDSSSWRREVFEWYKWARRKKREEQTDEAKEKINGFVNSITDEIVEHVPWISVKVPGAEADDVIAVLAKKFSDSGSEAVVISSDSDFKQLLAHKRVRVWSPFDTKFVDAREDPYDHLYNQVVRGDGNKDGVPNVMSDDDTFACEDKKQAMVSKKRFETLYPLARDFSEHGLDHPEIDVNEVVAQVKMSSKDDLKKNLMRNFTLLDLITPATPEDIQRKILNETLLSFADIPAKHSNFYVYLMRRELNKVITQIESFA